MLHLRKSKLQPIGLDIGSDSIRMIQLEASGESPVVCAYASQSMPEEVRSQPAVHLPVACDLVKELIKHHEFVGRGVVASIPRSMIHVKNLRLPMMPKEELASAVQFEAKSVFPFDMETAHLQHICAGEVRQGNESRQEVIVLAVKRDDVDNFVEMLHHAGAVVESLDYEAAAVYRSVERFLRRREDELEVNVLADIGLRRTKVIIGRGREIHFLKPIEIGGQHLNEAVANKLGITTEEARTLRYRIAHQNEESQTTDSVRQAVYDTTRTHLETLGREISLCLRYYSVTFRGQRPTRVRLVGGEANDPQVVSVLGSVLPVPVEASKSLTNVDTSRMKPHDRQGILCEWATALGLGLKKTTGTFAARDGKPRSTPVPVETGSSAEVVDLNRAVGSGIPANVEDAPPARLSNSQMKEVTHA